MRYPVNISCRISCWESWDIMKITIYPDEISLPGRPGRGNRPCHFAPAELISELSGFTKHSDWLMAQLLLSTSRARRWLLPGPWLPVARASCWVAAAAWSRRRRRSGPAMATGPPGPSCLSALRQSVICEMLVCVCIACIILHSYPNYPTYLSQLSYKLISIILHTYPNYPTYLVIYPTYPLHAYVADKQTR